MNKLNKPKPVTMDFNNMIGSLGRLLSAFLLFTESPKLDEVDAQTLKHHADDLIGVGTHALKKLAQRGREVNC